MRSIFSIPAAAAGLLLSTLALADGGPAVGQKEGLGRFLTDGTGRTLYLFKKDTPGQSACQGECLAKWPAYLAEGAPVGLDAKDFATITRPDGKKQTTYKGQPLYYFAADQASGDAKGQGVKEVWYVVAP
jgi:predicted lipoprotein with Yx(FWY)xxD motif